MSNRLGIDIGADNSELKRVAADTIKALDQVEQKAEQNAKKLRDSGKRGGKGFKDLGKGAANALPALTDVSRVIQDAPFGIIGVGNNITQLATSFGNLQKDTGGAGAAIKALGTSLAGPGGLVFGVSAVVSLLTVLGPELFKLKGATIELANAQAEAVAQAKAEGLELAALVQIAKSKTSSDQAKTNAIQELNDKYGDYLGNLDRESILSEKTSKLVDQLTESLKKQALARGALELITEKSKQLFEIQNDLGKSVGFQAVALGALKNAFTPTAASAGITSEAFKVQQEEAAELQRTINRLIFSYRELKEDALSDAPQKIKKVTDELKKQTGALTPSADISGLDLDSIFAVRNPEQITEKLDNQIFAALERTSARLRENTQIVKEGLTPMEKALEDFNTRAGEIIGGSIASTFGDIGTAIGDALVNGGSVINAVGSTVLGGFAALLNQLGDLAIQTGVGIAAVKASLETLNPALAIGAGIALKAVAAAFASGAAQIGSQIKGSSGSVGGISAGGGSASLVSSPSVRQGQESTVVFEIAGTKLVGVLNRTLARSGRTLSDSI